DHPDVRAAVDELQVPPGEARVTDVRSQETVLRVLVADVQLPDEQRSAQFVVVHDAGRQLAEVRNRAWTYALLAVLVLAAVAVLSHLLLGRLLRPLTELREATALSTTDDLSR